MASGGKGAGAPFTPIKAAVAGKTPPQPHGIGVSIKARHIFYIPKNSLNLGIGA